MLTYNNAGRLVKSSKGTVAVSYSYNALGQRVGKTSATGSSLFVYDQQGHLLGEYQADGKPVQETIWLGDTPVAVLSTTGASANISYIWADHLGTPRQITDPASKQILWRWDGEPFGNSLADEDPSKTGKKFSYNLRFPGQYFDKETGKHYNYFRDYDPATGRYIQSDPIGLAGGINTYGYVGGNPLNAIDPNGLAGVRPSGPMSGVPNKGDGCKVPRAPDFVNFQLDLYVFSVWGTFSRDGHSFAGGGFNRGYSNPLNLNASVSAGWLNTWTVKPGQTNGFLSGYAGGGNAAYTGVGGGLVYSPGSGTATVVGVGVGYAYGSAAQLAGGPGGGYTKDQGETGISWDPAALKCGCDK
ncbi:hypothetical protein HA050_17285 [Iodobacter sp. HSC-16F04]|uniref:Teneurin-like YD-shell domain-containing protein n=1 Tax=Iodobacter violaceini TaxID=3044271 RepID=A0ABX0KT66_9NEIS|nr:hypothetical protein [Iodobacter violacea]